LAIQFHLESSGKIKLHSKEKIKFWLEKVIIEEGYVPGKISIVLTSDEKLLNLNMEFFKKDYLTDIITFEYSEKGKIAGDIFISIERVVENAGKYKVSYREELMRVFVHGVLHLLGYNDKRRDEKSEMKE